MSVPGKQNVCVHIRWMIRRDMPEVLSIENESFEFPWSEEDFIRCLRQRNCIGMVAEHHDRVVVHEYARVAHGLARALPLRGPRAR